MTVKRISILLTLFCFCFCSFGQETVLIDDFESGDKGWSPVDPGWVDFDIVDNPRPNEVNSSNKVMKIVRHSGTQTWAGIILRDHVNLSLGILPEQYRYAHVKFYKETTGKVAFKFEKNGNSGSYTSVRDYPPSGEWQEIIFDLAGAAGSTYDDFFIMPDQTENPNQNITIYIDDIVLKKDPDAGNGNYETELPGTFQLIWADEFEGTTYDPSIWSPQISGGGFGNNELQYYTGNEKNIFIRDGSLVLKAYKENYNNHAYTSGKLWGQSKKSFQYGRVEARFKLPKGRGTWPAIWMMPQSSVYGGWPRSGEIDIMEFVGYNPNLIHGTVHREAGSGGNGNGSNISIEGKTDEFHIIRIDWEPGYIKWYLNDVLFHTYSNGFIGSAQWPFDQNFYVILNFAVGGDWGGAQGVDTNIWPQEFLIDYVRVYQKSGETTTRPFKKDEAFGISLISDKELKVTGSSRLPLQANIYSPTGQSLLVERDIFPDSSIDISALPKGIYIVTVSDGTLVHSQKIIK